MVWIATARAEGPEGAGDATGVLWVVLPVFILAAAWLLRKVVLDRRQLGRLRQRNARLSVANVALRETVERADGKARLLDGAMAALTDGIMVTDAELRLASWNSRFSDFTGVPRRALRIGMPIEEVIRMQAEAGEFGLVDPERETARRMHNLRHGPTPERWVRERPDGSLLELRRAALPGGGFVTLYTPVAGANPVPIEASLLDAFRAEWIARTPRLTAAAADGDAPRAQATAHALRGIAANAGWQSVVGTLAALEAAAGAGDVTEVRLLTGLVPADPPAAG